MLEFLQRPKYLSLISARYLVQVLYLEAYINPTEIRRIRDGLQLCFHVPLSYGGSMRETHSHRGVGGW